MTYQQAHKMWTTSRKRKLAPNTYLEKWGNAAYAIRFHDTYIIKMFREVTVLNSGGWRTVTTKDRLNRFGPVRIYQKDFVWYVSGGCEFYDGIEIPVEPEE